MEGRKLGGKKRTKAGLRWSRVKKKGRKEVTVLMGKGGQEGKKKSC